MDEKVESNAPKLSAIDHSKRHEADTVRKRKARKIGDKQDTEVKKGTCNMAMSKVAVQREVETAHQAQTPGPPGQRLGLQIPKHVVSKMEQQRGEHGHGIKNPKGVHEKFPETTDKAKAAQQLKPHKAA